MFGILTNELLDGVFVTETVVLGMQPYEEMLLKVEIAFDRRKFGINFGKHSVQSCKNRSLSIELPTWFIFRLILYYTTDLSHTFKW